MTTKVTYNTIFDKKLSRSSQFDEQSKADLTQKFYSDLLMNKTVADKQQLNMSIEEYQQIRKNALKKTLKIIGGCLLAATVLSVSGIYAFKSGKFDKQINKVLSSDNKIIAYFRKKLNSKVKHEISEKLDFGSAKKHFHNIGTKDGQISGAHEIKECIKTLKKEQGAIFDIKQSKTQNGLWEIFYEIDGIKVDTAKTIYISNPLTDKDANDLISLCRKNFSKRLLDSVNKLVNEQSIYNIPKMEATTEAALREGVFIRTKGLINATLKAKENIGNLTSKLQLSTNNYNLAEQRVSQLKKELQELKKVVEPTYDEFQSKVKEISSEKAVLKKLKSECDSLKSSLAKGKEHYNHVKNSVNILGEKDGMLFAGYAHYDNNRIVVDSYFPITHGSSFQNELVDNCLDENLLSIANLKCLIGAKESQINKFLLQLGNKFKKWLKTNYTKILRDSYLGLIAASDLITASDIKKKNNEDKKI